MHAEETFQQTMRGHGIEPPEEVIADGVLHRFHVSGDKPRTENGWYVLHGDEPAAGAFGCWKRGISETWTAKDDRSLTAEEKTRHKARMASIRQQRAEEQARVYAECRRASEDLWNKAREARADHPYLMAKGIKPAGIRQIGNAVVVPVQDFAGTLHGLQFIGPDGSKRYKAGTDKTGHFFQLPGDPSKPLLICEGYATGASLHECTGYDVFVAFDAGNVDPVARAIHKAMPERAFIVCADNDQWTKGNPGLTKATAAAREVGALLAVPTFQDNSTKPTDFNDLLRLEGLEAVRRCIEAATEPKEALSDTGAESPYFLDEAGHTCRWKKTKDGQVPVRISNFSARIEREIAEDDGQEVSHLFEITGETKDGPLPAIEIPAKHFTGMQWLTERWGNRAIIEPGPNMKDFARHSIQVQSHGVKRTARFSHTGFREINGRLAYLSAGGAIGAENVQVRLSRELQRYCLPSKPDNEAEAIRTSLSFLDVARREVSLPLLALCYLAPLTTTLETMPNFSGYLYGESGGGKSTLATILLDHFGNFQSLSSLPNFEDTANNLEKRAFVLKDTLMVLDDFHPSTKRVDAERMEGTAQRLIRSYSNRTGRGRLNADSSDKGRYEPRGMLLITGEEMVKVPSTLARLMVVELSRGDIDFSRLTALQGQADSLPHAMSSYILWIIEHVQGIKSTFKDQFPRLRARATGDGLHAKLPEQCAFLQFALNTCLSWALDKQVLTDGEAAALSTEAWGVFLGLAQAQGRRIGSEDPVNRFVEVFNTLVDQGRVKIESKNDAYGIRIIGDNKGDLIGWYDELYFYLLPRALWHSIQEFCLREGTHFPVSERTLSSMLQGRGIIAETGGESTSKLVKIRGEVKRALKVYRRELALEDTEHDEHMEGCHEPDLSGKR